MTVDDLVVCGSCHHSSTSLLKLSLLSIISGGTNYSTIMVLEVVEVVGAEGEYDGG